MKKGLLRAVGILSIVLLPALALAANEPATEMRTDVSADLKVAPAERRQDKKSKRKKADDKREVDKKDNIKKDDIKKDGKKPDIKEVPRSVPKLKPKTVTDKIKIKRPPVKIKPKGLLRVL